MTCHKGNDPDAPLERAEDLYDMPGWAVEMLLQFGFTINELLVADFPARDGPVAEVIDLDAARLRYLRLSELNRLARARL